MSHRFSCVVLGQNYMKTKSNFMKSSEFNPNYAIINKLYCLFVSRCNQNQEYL